MAIDLKEKEIWRHMAGDLCLCLMRLKPRSKEPIGKWQDLPYRPFDSIGFQPEDNAAVITNDIIVLDVDNVELFNREVPETFTVKTGKGFHYYFKRPDDADYRPRSRKAEGFDIRANGGYVVAPGSIHPDGSLYEVVKDVPMATAPEWLLELSRGGKPRIHHDRKPLGELPEVDLGRLDSDIQRLLIDGAPEGERSEAIHKVMHRMVEAGYDREEIISAFLSNVIGEKAQEKNDPEGWLSDELDRILDTKVERVRAIPNHLKPEFMTLAEESEIMLVHMLHDWNNQVSIGQREVLGKLLKAYAGMAQGILRGRNAVRLPTGYGKTTSIIAFLGTAHQKKMLGKFFTVAVAASRVEQIEEIYEQLLNAGVPHDCIALVHHDENAKYPASKGIDREFLTHRPIILLTHNKLIGKKLHQDLVKRTFIIWDESLISTEVWCVDLKELAHGFTAFKDAAKRYGVRHETVEHVQECEKLIEASIEQQKETGQKSAIIIPLWTGDIAVDDINVLISKEKHRGNRMKLKILKNTLEKNELSVHIAKSTELLVGYEVIVPDDLENIIVLDASTDVNELMMLDKSMSILDFPEIPIRYKDTVVHRIDHGAGRDATEKALTAGTLQPVILEILRKHSEEHVLLFTFKPHDGELNHRQAIEEYLTENGEDIHEQLNGMNKLNWLTFGRENASNKFAHCTVAIFVGVLHLKDETYTSMTIGQMRDHACVVHPRAVTKVLRGLQAQALHQGMNRCASRTVNDDVAGAVDVYYTYPDDSLKGYLMSVLPDADFKVYSSEVLKPRTKKREILQRIASALKELPETMLSISTRALKEQVPELKSLSKKHCSRVMALVNEDTGIGWSKEGRSLVRV